MTLPHVKSLACAALLALSVHDSAAQQPGRVSSSEFAWDINEILQRVSAGVEAIGPVLSTLECTEHITSHRHLSTSGSYRWWLGRRRDSTASSFKRRSGSTADYNDPSGPPFMVTVEHTDPEFADQSLDIGDRRFSYLGPGYGSILALTFLPRNLPYHEYTFGERDASGMFPDAVAIEFETMPGQQALRFRTQEGSRPFIDHGTAWIDPDSGRVLAIERHFTNHPDYDELSVIVDYDAVSVRGSEYWAPVAFRSEHRKGPLEARHAIEYASCRQRIVP